MSTTWVFLGLLLETRMSIMGKGYSLGHPLSKVFQVFKDLGSALFGLLISIF